MRTACIESVMEKWKNSTLSEKEKERGGLRLIYASSFLFPSWFRVCWCRGSWCAKLCVLFFFFFFLVRL